jgi:hypothetical protein
MTGVRTCLLVAVALTAAGCSKGPLELTNIQVGRSLNQDGSVASITTRFKPSETVYVAVQTSAGEGTIGVRWLYQGRVIDQPEKKVSSSSPASTDFQLTNSGGFPEGDYSVEIFIDGTQVGSRSFKVGS